VWSNPTQFQLDENYKPTLVSGVPPDYFSKDGQVWGNPLYNYSVMKKDGFTWWKKRISFTTELFDGVRIDHFRGFESYYAVPYGAKTAVNGKWVKGPGASIIKAIKSASNGKLIIAEDLGEITSEVRKLVDNSGFPGMRVMQFGFLSENSTHLPHNYINNCVAYTGTHDNNTLLGYVWELDEETRVRMLNYFDFKGEWDTCYDSIIKAMLRSSAGLTIFPIQDVLKFGADTRLNTPGSADKNWAYRITKQQLDSIDVNYYRYLNNLYSR
jgi:4-alpha-glucanotransferase